ncbi:MAG: capsule assembly Wzi family protein [Candidatus Eiseniibacteriota bacterium]
MPTRAGTPAIVGAARRTMVAALLLISTVLALASLASRAAAEPAEFLPVGSAHYSELEVLVARGLVDSLRIYTRPLVRVDIAHALLRARRLHPEVTQNLNYQRLEREFVRELTDLGQPPETGETGPLFDFGPRDSRFRIQSAAHVLGDFDDHRDPHYRFRDETAVGVRASLQLWPAFGAYEDIAFTRIRSDRAFIDPAAKNTDVEVAVLHTELTGRSGAVTGAVGYDAFRWGPGHRGTLLFSEAGGPMGFLMLQGNAVGRLTATAVSGVLSDAENRMFAAHRLEFAATKNLTLGVAEAVRYSNDGIDLLYGIGLIPYSLVERINVRQASSDSVRSAVRSNVMVSTDAAFRLSPSLTLYGEFLIDDFTTEDKSMPDRFGWQAGLRSDRPMGPGMIHFLAEYAMVRNFTYSVYYGQSFVYHDRPLGYELGPDVEDLWLEVGYDLSRDWQVRWTGDFIRKGEGQIGQAWDPSMGPVDNSKLSGIVEEAREVWGDLRWLPRDNVDLSVGLGYRQRENIDHQDGVDENSFLMRMAAELRY